jgi:hypothetical protein
VRTDLFSGSGGHRNVILTEFLQNAPQSRHLSFRFASESFSAVKRDE